MRIESSIIASIGSPDNRIQASSEIGIGWRTKATTQNSGGTIRGSAYLPNNF